MVTFEAPIVNPERRMTLRYDPAVIHPDLRGKAANIVRGCYTRLEELRKMSNPIFYGNLIPHEKVAFLKKVPFVPVYGITWN